MTIFAQPPDEGTVGAWRVMDIAPGWQPTPFRQFILKVHSRCNLACKYCYMYEMADQSWRSSPLSMSMDVLEQTGRRIADHVRDHRTSAIEVIFHGGEPLLVGAEALAAAADTIRWAVPVEVGIRFVAQTNGLLLTHPALRILGSRGLGLGISIDGSAETHDRNRVTRVGRGSHARVAAALALLNEPEHRHLYAGLLAVMDVSSDPTDTYEALLAFRPPSIDFLFPHRDWSRPQGPADRGAHGRWLTAIFDRWYDAPVRETGIRLFEELINLLLGGQSQTEQIGLSPVAMIVVNTDGTLEQVDTLRSTHAGAASTGLTVFSHDLDAALRHPAIMARQIGAAALGDECRTCPLRAVCGGGHYAHRYRPGLGFRNPSVYCEDLALLIRHVQTRLKRDLTLISRVGP